MYITCTYIWTRKRIEICQWPCSQVAPGFLCNLLLGSSIHLTYLEKKKNRNLSLKQQCYIYLHEKKKKIGCRLLLV